MNRLAIKDAAVGLERIAQAARSGQITILLDDGKPAAVVASGSCDFGEVKLALAATHAEAAEAGAATMPGEVRFTRAELSGGWPSAIKHVAGGKVVVVTESDGKACAGIVADPGPAREGAIGMTAHAEKARNDAAAGGREVQITRHRKAVAQIVPPGRIRGVPAGLGASRASRAAHRETLAPGGGTRRAANPSAEAHA